MEPAAFLNLDLELRSKADLASLGEHFDKVACVLFNGEAGGEFQVTVEPHGGGHPNQSPQQCTEEMLDVLSKLPDNLRTLFQGCHTRIFDYGFDGGLQSPPLSIDIEATELSRIAALGISLRVTVYPYRPDPPVNEGAIDA